MSFARTVCISSVLLCSSVFLSACGFKPMHAPNGFGSSGLHYMDIAVTTVHEEKIDFLLKQALRDRMGNASGNTRYSLQITPRLARRSLGVGSDDVASRYDLTMAAKFELVDRKSREIMFQGTARATSTFAAPRDPYGRISAENNATEQVARETADRILIRLARYQAGK